MRKKNRSDHGREFENEHFKTFCDEHDTAHILRSNRSTRWDNWKKDRSVQELARRMLNAHNLPNYFWAEAVVMSFGTLKDMVCSIANRVLIRNIETKSPYELWHRRTPTEVILNILVTNLLYLINKDSYKNMILILWRHLPWLVHQ